MTLTLPQTACLALCLYKYSRIQCLKISLLSNLTATVVWDLALILNFNQFVIAVSD